MRQMRRRAKAADALGFDRVLGPADGEEGDGPEWDGVRDIRRSPKALFGTAQRGAGPAPEPARAAGPAGSEAAGPLDSAPGRTILHAAAQLGYTTCRSTA